MTGIIPYPTVHSFVTNQDHVGFTLLDGAQIPFPAKARGPLKLQGRHLYFALRFDMPVTEAQIGTPMASLTVPSRVPGGCAMVVEGHLSICHENSIREHFNRNLYRANQFHIMCMKCTVAFWLGRNSNGIHHFQ